MTIPGQLPGLTHTSRGADHVRAGGPRPPLDAPETGGDATHVDRPEENPARPEVERARPAEGRFRGIGASSTDDGATLTASRGPDGTVVRGEGSAAIHVRNRPGGGVIITSGEQRVELDDREARQLTIEAEARRVRVDQRVDHQLSIREPAPERPGPRSNVVDPPPPGPSAEDLARYDAAVTKIKNHPAYRALSPEARKKAYEIMRLARNKPNPNYYAEKLELLFNTPDAPPAKTATRNNTRITESVEEAEVQLKTEEGRAQAGQEEAISGDASRRWTTLQGEGATYQVDRSDPENVVVRMKVHLEGDADDVAKIKKLEDAIEKSAGTNGYTLDLEFVNSGGSDVFTVDVDPSRWATSGNWAGGSDTLAHEAHHLLNLPDRYNYIESHADNASMKMETRLHWFLVQTRRPSDPNGHLSIMHSGWRKPLHDDVCQVAQMPDEAKCVDARTQRYGGP